MNIHIYNSSSSPIYEQILDQIRDQILSGALKAGEKLPSIRYLAKELRISVITTKRAYDELEREGLIHSVQGKGSFVAHQNQEMVKEEYLKKFEESLLEALNYARIVGLSKREIVESIELLEGENESDFKFD